MGMDSHRRWKELYAAFILIRIVVELCLDVNGIRDSVCRVDGIRDSVSYVGGIRDSVSYEDGIRDSVCYVNGIADSVSYVNGIRDSVCYVNGIRDSVFYVNGIRDSVFYVNWIRDSVTCMDFWMASILAVDLMGGKKAKDLIRKTKMLSTVASMTVEVGRIQPSGYLFNASDRQSTSFLLTPTFFTFLLHLPLSHPFQPPLSNSNALKALPYSLLNTWIYQRMLFSLCLVLSLSCNQVYAWTPLFLSHAVLSLTSCFTLIQNFWPYIALVKSILDFQETFST